MKPPNTNTTKADNFIKDNAAKYLTGLLFSAQAHIITLEQLEQSPNYEELFDEAQRGSIEHMKRQLKTKAEFLKQLNKTS